MPQPSARAISLSSWLPRILSAEALATLRILPRNGRIAWVSRLRACLAEPPALSPSTRKISVPAALSRVQSASFPGSRIRAQPMIEMILDCVLDEPRRLGRREPLLGLTLELGVADEQRQQHRRVCRNVFSGGLGYSAIVDQLAISLDPAQQRAAQTSFVGPSFGGRNGVAVGMAEAVFLVFGPRYRPLDAAAVGKIDAAEKRPRRQNRPPIEARREEVTEPARKVQPRLGRNSLRARHCGIAAPPNLQSAKQISLGACHAVERRRPKSDVAENLGIGMEPQGRAAAVVHRAAVDEPGFRHPAS